MPFQPSTNVYIGTVPFDPSYRHVRYFSDREAQQQYFAALCPMSLRREDYTYQRVDDSIVVPFNAETLYGYNYCMFKNENYGDRWFYSFITDVEYVNPNSSRLHLSLDIMQTWFPDCTVKACMVEREHVDDDTIGMHIKDEGLDPGELIVDYYSFDNQNQYLYPVVASAVEPLKDGTYVNVGGDKYMGVYSGCSLSVFTTISELKSYIDALSSNGQQDAISAIYLVPDFCVQNRVKKDNGWGYWVDASAGTPTEDYSLNVGMGSLDGYVPKNNKTLCYPNQYFEVTNFNGGNQKFRLEFFGTKGTASFDKTGGCSMSSTLAYIPKNYNGNAGRSVEHAVYMEAFPTCMWVYQAWANMYGQSQVDLFGLKFNSQTDLPFMNNAMNGAQRLVGSATRLDLLGMANDAVDTVQDQVNAFASLSKATRTPNTSRGGMNTTTSLVNLGSYTVGFRKYTCRREMAKQIDNYYSMYGYLVSEIKVPNVVGRRSWNYVKTNGSSVVGKVPAGTLAQINRLFDRGITFWHVNDVGNYALDNSIV